MASIKPRISVEYTDNATIVTFVDEKILEEMDIQALQGSIMPVVEETERIKLILDSGFIIRMVRKPRKAAMACEYFVNIYTITVLPVKKNFQLKP